MDTIKLNEEETRVGLKDVKNSLVYAYKSLIEGIKKNSQFNLKFKPRKEGNTLYYPNIRDNAGNHDYGIFENEVRDFETVLDEKVGRNNCTLLVANLESLKIRGLVFQLPTEITGEIKFSSFYSAQNNEMLVRVGKKYNYSALIEELMMVAGTNRRTSSEEVKTGFNHKDYRIRYGMGLTSGYASVLCYRYFQQKGYRPDYGQTPFFCMAAPYNVNYTAEKEIPVNLEFCIASMIEQIVGKETMENMFFTANSNKLIEELGKYDSIDNVRRFLIELDEYKSNTPELAHHLLLTVSQWFYIKQVRERQSLSEGFHSPNSLLEFQSKIPNFYSYEGNVYPIDKTKLREEAKVYGEQALITFEKNNTPGFPRAHTYLDDEIRYRR